MRFDGQVLARNLDAYLALVADMMVRPMFAAAELERTRREIHRPDRRVRNDDRTLCARFFERRLYGDHPYGHPPDGSPAARSVTPPRRRSAHFRSHSSATT